ncbi:MAG: 1,4-alpha-glucan branching protein GlgB [Simkaniaceae bacterium]|nr:1,4-alpha-glucan branching protein GlgB [Candidatus Sacchlamyda saccharinae]
MQDNTFNHSDPHSYLGLNMVDETKTIIRIWRPGSSDCLLEVFGKPVEAKKVHESGLFEYEVPAVAGPTDYRIHGPNGTASHDPYAFPSTIDELDADLLSKGLHYELYNLLGSTPKVHHGVEGIQFSVWAPNALSVSLIGDFNQWNGLVTPMRLIADTGVWEIFLPGLTTGEKYKYEIMTREKERLVKSDPVSHFSEMRPNNSSIVFDVNQFSWSDEKWLAKRDKNGPISIYEIHLASWQQGLNYRELASRIVAYCQKMHYTHVELIGICEHPLDESWGYQVTGYFAPTSRLGTPEDFQCFVNFLHENDIGVILDWVPAHFPSDSHSIAKFDGTFLYEHKDPRQGFHPHWNTHIFNYGRWEVSNFLIASALFWFEKMHIDGLRVDAVSSMLYLDYGRDDGEWIPNHKGTNINLEAVEFIKHLNSIVKKRFPDCLMIAEEASAYPGVTSPDGLGFDLKWNMGWMNDTLDYFSCDFSEREENFSKFAFIKEYAFHENYVLVLSHDEVVHEKKSLFAKMPGDQKQKMQGLRLLISFMMCFPGKKLLFMGGELGQKTEWNPKESIHWDLLDDPAHLHLQEMVAALNQFYQKNPIDQGAFSWLETEAGVLAYKDKSLIYAHNFLAKPMEIALPETAQLIFCSDSAEWESSAILRPLSTHVFRIDEQKTL